MDDWWVPPGARKPHILGDGFSPNMVHFEGLVFDWMVMEDVFHGFKGLEGSVLENRVI